MLTFISIAGHIKAQAGLVGVGIVRECGGIFITRSLPMRYIGIEEYLLFIEVYDP